jgi:uncharacterized protein YjbJ (UPF0337 family)
MRAKTTLELTPLNDVQDRKVQRHNIAASSKRKEFAMDWNRVEGNWKQLKGKIKEQWGHLKDDELDKIAGRREQLEGKIQEHYGLTKDAARKDVDDWIMRQ